MTKVQRVANVFFIAIIAATLSAVIGYEAAQRLIPGFKAPTVSYMEGREYQHFQKPTAGSVFNGSFQQSFSKFVADDIPLRDDVITSAAAVQRAIIELANTPFEFDTYPTFLGSNVLYSPIKNRVFEMPLLQSAGIADSLDAAAEIWGAFIERHSDIRWFAFMPDRSCVSFVNPGHELISSPADRSFWVDHFFSKLPESCTYIDGAYKSAEEWEKDFFLTDHHWQIRGGLSAYRTIAEQLGVTPIQHSGFYKTDLDEFWGSITREGIIFSCANDEIWDVAYVPSTLAVRIDGVDVAMSSLDMGFKEASIEHGSSSKFSKDYDAWFHTDYGHIEIENDSAETDKVIIIIGDSFSSNIERFFAENYRTVHVIDLRIYKDGLEQLIHNVQPDDILCIISVAWNDGRVLPNLY